MTEFFIKSAENYFIIFAHKFADFFFRKNQKVRNFFIEKEQVFPVLFCVYILFYLVFSQ